MLALFLVAEDPRSRGFDLGRSTFIIARREIRSVYIVPQRDSNREESTVIIFGQYQREYPPHT